MQDGVLREGASAESSEAFTAGSVGEVSGGGGNGHKAGVLAFMGSDVDVVVGLKPTQRGVCGFGAANSRQN